MKHVLLSTLRSFTGTFLALGAILLVASVATAWVNPSATPPGNDVLGPIDVGPTDQAKNGPFGAPTVAANEFCLSGDCISQWADGISFSWDSCRRLTGGSFLQCNSDEYLVDAMCSDEGSDPDCGSNNIKGGYGGYLARSGSGGHISILCCP